YAPVGMVQGMNFEQAYALMDAWVIAALGDLGIQAWYQPLNDLASPAGQIAGAAHARRGDAVLHQVAIGYDIDANTMLEGLRIGREKLSDKGTTSAQKRVDPLRSQTGMAREAVIEVLVESFRKRHGGLTADTLRANELERAYALVAEKFGTADWTAVVP